MGSSKWSDAVYTANVAHLMATNQSVFAYDTATKAQVPVESWKPHSKMDPHGVTMRESRDSDVYPETLAVGVIFDVTGSMGTIPEVLQKKLSKLMSLLISRGYVEQPHILFGAVGDANTDKVPLQIGQFEAGNEMDDDLAKLLLEGGGGGQVHESYGLALYFFAHHTSIDCWEKRKRKGFLFTIGDEKPWDPTPAAHILQVVGDKVEAGQTMKDMIAAVSERYEYFHIIATRGAHGSQQDVASAWKSLLGERALLLDDPGAVTETIATTIGLALGKADLVASLANLKEVGTEEEVIQSVGAAVSAYYSTHHPVVSSQEKTWV